jgi:hypothetical protein
MELKQLSNKLYSNALLILLVIRYNLPLTALIGKAEIMKVLASVLRAILLNPINHFSFVIFSTSFFSTQYQGKIW